MGKRKKGNNMGKCKSRTNTLGNETSNPSSVKELFFSTFWRKSWRAALEWRGKKGQNFERIWRKFYFGCPLRGRAFADYRRTCNSVLPRLWVIPVIQRGLYNIRKGSQHFFNDYIVNSTILQKEKVNKIRLYWLFTLRSSVPWRWGNESQL